MIDQQALAELIQKQIKDTVDQQVAELLSDQQIADKIEKQVVATLQDRIVAKFSNISTVPDLIKTVEGKVVELFNQGRISELSTLVDHRKVQKTIDDSIQNLITQSLDNLVVDPAWTAKIENMINVNMSSKLGQRLKDFDLNQAISDNVEQGLDRWTRRFSEEFRTVGIVDDATVEQVEIQDGTVTIKEKLISTGNFEANNAQVDGDLVVNNLILRGKINIDNSSWNELTAVLSQQMLDSLTVNWQNQLVDHVIEHASTQGIEFDHVLIDRKPIFKDGILNSSIKHSAIETVGKLKELSVSGKVSLADTATVKKGRVGINTESPEMALSIWDEDVNLILGKMDQQQAFIGSGRAQNLAIGVNRKTAVEIDQDGLTSINALRIDRWRLAFSNTVPGHSGTRGDFVVNNDPKPGTPFAWVCLGGFKWQALYSSTK